MHTYKPIIQSIYTLTFILLMAGCLGEDTALQNSNANEQLCTDCEFVQLKYFNQTSPDASVDVSSNGAVVDEVDASKASPDVQIKLSGLRVRTSNFNYVLKSIKVLENDGSNFVEQTDFNPSQSISVSDVACVLAVDLTSSLSDNLSDLKANIKTFVDTILSASADSKVALLLYSSRNEIETTPFYTDSDKSILLARIDNISRTDDKNRTALLEATQQSLDMLSSLSFDGSKSVVIFTDGGDNDSNNPSDLKASIQSSDITRIAIGLTGEVDFEQQELIDISTKKSFFHIADDDKDLTKIFRIVSQGITSVYDVLYSRSDQQLSKDNAISIRFELDIERID